MNQYPYAAYAMEGQRHRIHHDGKLHSIVSVIPSDDFTHTTIVFDDPANSSYTFRTWDEVLSFPRRQDGSLVDWRLEPHPPKPWQLYVGDRVQSAIDPDGPIEYVDPQVIVSVRNSTVGVGGLVLYDVVTSCKSDQGARRWRFVHDEDVTWPRIEITRETGIRALKTGELEWHGPYRHRETGALFEFAEHPTGRGRWPASVPKYDPEANEYPQQDEPYRCRFPRYDWDINLEPLDPSLPIGRTAKWTKRQHGMTFESSSMTKPIR